MGLFYTFIYLLLGSILKTFPHPFQPYLIYFPISYQLFTQRCSFCPHPCISPAPCSSSSFVALLLCIISVISEPGGAWAQSLLVGRCRQGATLMQKAPQCFPPSCDWGAFPFNRKLERGSCRSGYVQLIAAQMENMQKTSNGEVAIHQFPLMTPIGGNHSVDFVPLL